MNSKSNSISTVTLVAALTLALLGSGITVALAQTQTQTQTQNAIAPQSERPQAAIFPAKPKNTVFVLFVKNIPQPGTKTMNATLQIANNTAIQNTVGLNNNQTFAATVFTKVPAAVNDQYTISINGAAVAQGFVKGIFGFPLPTFRQVDLGQTLTGITTPEPDKQMILGEPQSQQ